MLWFLSSAVGFRQTECLARQKGERKEMASAKERPSSAGLLEGRASSASGQGWGSFRGTGVLWTRQNWLLGWQALLEAFCLVLFCFFCEGRGGVVWSFFFFFFFPLLFLLVGG